MKTEDQIRIEITTQVVEDFKTQLNDETLQLEKQFEEVYKSKLESDIQNALEIAQSGCTNTSPKTKDSENKKFQNQLANLRFEKECADKKLKALEQFH